jgi:hypothetical protein
VFRYANASGHLVTGSVFVNDRFVGNVCFLTRAEWSAWTTDAYVQAGLQAGPNSVTLRLDEETDGTVLVDHQDERRRHVEFTVPRLAYWDMVYVKQPG